LHWWDLCYLVPLLTVAFKCWNNYFGFAVCCFALRFIIMFDIFKYHLYCCFTTYHTYAIFAFTYSNLFHNLPNLIYMRLYGKCSSGRQSGGNPPFGESPRKDHR
jgi:hypothetical protein